jgi:hypothetical protein
MFIASCTAENPNGISFGASDTQSYSIDGINWDTSPATYNASVETIIYKNIFIAQNGEIYFIAIDGSIHNASGDVVSSLPGEFYGIGCCHNGKVIVEVSGDAYYSQDDFLTWTSIDFFNNKSVTNIEYFNNNFIVFTTDENDEHHAYVSTDCINWQKGDEVNAYLMCSNDTQIIALSNNKLYCSYDGINWFEGSNQDIYKLEKENEGMFVTIPEQTVERRIIKEEHNNTPHIRFEDEALIFSSLEDVIEGNQSNHPEGSYYVVYDDTILLNANNINNYFEITYEDWDTNEFYWNENNEFVNDWSTSITRAIVENTSSPTLKALINLNLSFIAQIQNPEYSNSLSISNSVNSNTIRLGYNTELTNAINIDLNKGDTITLEHVDSASIAKLIDMKINLL